MGRDASPDLFGLRNVRMGLDGRHPQMPRWGPKPREEPTMPRLTGTAFAASAIVAAAALAVLSQPAAAQTTLTMSSWVSPSHLLTKDVLAVWGQQVEKATNGRVKLQMLPKHPSAAPGTLDAVRDGLVDVSYVTASYTPARHVMPLLAELPGGGATSVINSVAYS